MFHLGAYYGPAGDAVEADLPALSDDILTIQNGHFVLSQPMQLLGAQAVGDDLVRARLASPSMRQIASPYIRPISVNAAGTQDANIWLLDYNPFVIRPFEEIQALAADSSGNTSDTQILIWLADAIAPLPSGNVIPLRITSTTASVDATWTTLSITYQDTLPGGAYAMVFSEHFSNNGIAHRWIVPNQLWRPGFPSITDINQRLPYALSKGQFGLMGRFRSNDLPRVQVLTDGSDNAHEIYLHVVRIGDIGIPYGPF